MKKIYKYTIEPNNLKIEMPKNAKIIHVYNQREHVCLWAEVDVDQQNYLTEIRQFVVVPTGGYIPEYPDVTAKHLGTVKMSDGLFIYHVYELVRNVEEEGK